VEGVNARRFTPRELNDIEALHVQCPVQHASVIAGPASRREDWLSEIFTSKKVSFYNSLIIGNFSLWHVFC
jgi:hypothetical protein